MTFEPIAIVGQACVLPGALSPSALWEKVRAGTDLLGRAPAGRWRLAPERALGTPERWSDRTWTDRGGYVRGFEEIFDASGFGLPAEELAPLDPLFHWLLHVGREALRDARLEANPRVGAIFGNLSFPSAGMSRFAERRWLGERFADAAGIPASDPRNRFTSGLPAHLLSSALGLGEAFCLDAACASSLYAIKLACDRLHDRSADAMLAGAVNCADDLFIHVGFCALQAMSRTGRSRPFHRDADGLVPAEGAGAVALKRLADAERSGDRILGVLRGIGLSNDGRGAGMLAPSEDGQVRAMRLAYEQAGLRPEDVSLVECHATGTVVGDRTELRSLRRVFEGAHGLPIGSLKSNFGHAITAAGVAGLIKVLGALAAKERPPTLHAEAPLDELAGSPLRLLTSLEPWESAGPRRAAVSAFGFGGTNAHLVVEEHQPKTKWKPLKRSRPGNVAIVGIGAAVGAGDRLAAFEEALFAPAADRRRAGALSLGAKATRFPPRDLAQALPQQTWLLAAADEALAGLALPAPERIGVYVGMGCDPEVARYGARWRLAEWADAWGVDAKEWHARAADAFTAPLDAPGVLGTLPNLPANRLNFQHDVRGPGFTVSAEELSGVRALQLAARALEAGELDLALVGASDFSCEPVHEAAARALGIDGLPGDAGLVLCLQRAADAKAEGRTILALLDEETDATAFDTAAVEARFGRAHAALGLVQIAAAALCLARGKTVGGEGWPGSRRTRVELTALGGQSCAIGLRAADRKRIPATEPAPIDGGPVQHYPAHAKDVVLPALPAQDDARSQWLRLQPLAPPSEGERMPPAPTLAPILESDAAARPGPAAIAVIAESTGDRPPSRGGRGGGIASPSLSGPLPRLQALSVLASQQALLAQVHRQFVENQAAAQRAFLEMRERMARHLLEMGTGTAPRLPPAAVVAPPAPPRAPVLPGPKLDRHGLAIHASGKISEIFGPLFEQQDGHRLQVRMPEPPLLLADRLLGIDAAPGSMSKGKLWTETDITPESWYLHDGRMPAGLMIEAGQADLMLISWLGVDFLNRGERAYRLLGCDLTYHGGLPGPGETLHYEIRIDGHAQQGDIRLFFFQYDCTTAGSKRLSVRHGQAGFFTEKELADSGGVLWDAGTGERKERPRLDPPAVRCERARFDRAQLEAFASGRVADCFGPGFGFSATHTRTPRISGGRMLFLDEVTDFVPGGGPWGRGYLRAVDRIVPDDWFFGGHFKGDPCMPGTLMFEGCLQAMAVYLAGLGYTLDKDGWRFEPVPEETYKLRCRGQVTPESKELVYEVFVEEIEAGPQPTLWADLLCTVDGLKAFHCRRMGLRLVPGWPLDSRFEPLLDAGPVAKVDGFEFGYRSLLACAWGKPSEAFGPMYRVFDGPRRVPRLPGPPYHFMTRIAQVDGPIGGMKVGSSVVCEYDVPRGAWYFAANGARTMPFCVLLEAALQPCGWLASYVGSALGTEIDLSFRNLDGTGTLLAEIPPDAGTLVTKSTLTKISRSAGMIIESFDVTCSIAGRVVYEMQTVFGFFPKEALEAQKGLPVPDAERGWLDAPGERAAEVRPTPGLPAGRGDAPGPRLPSTDLLMIDRLTGIWPEAGAAKLGRYRSELTVDATAWFFKAHFFQDPVQPGSLGLEAMLQVLQFAMLDRGLAADGDRFEPIALGAALSWKYRGQVVPRNKRVRVLLELTRIEEDARGRTAFAEASLWVDDLRIYEAKNLGMRVVRGGPSSRDDRGDEETLSVETHPWLADHRPTWTVPALPMMSIVDRLAAAALRAAGRGRVVALEDVQLHRWLPVPGPVRTRTEASARSDGFFEVSLLAWREAARAELSRFEPVATARVLVGESYPTPDQPLPGLEGAQPVADPYEAGTLFHGPAFRLLHSLRRGPRGASALLDAGARPAHGLLHEALLDALTHAIPHDALSLWDASIDAGLVAYPHRLRSLRLFGELPRQGEVRCEVRFAGFDGDPRFPRFRIQALAGERVLAELDLVEALFPKGALGAAAPEERRSFLRDRRFVAGVRLSREEDGTSRLSDADALASDWLPGTLAGAYALEGADRTLEIAAKEHVAARARVHPSQIRVAGERARSDADPLTVWPLELGRRGETATARDAGAPALDLAPVRAYWDRSFGVGRWPVEDLYYGLAERFLRRVHLEDPAALAALRGRGVLYLANHQVALESLLFSVVLSGVTGVPTITLAKAEHRTTWLGRLIGHAFTWPGVQDPGVITFFDRAAQGELPKKVMEIAAELQTGGKSAMVHVEGTRALSCRAPVLKMSGAFLDMAIATGTPVVPVRFVGGLPVEPLPERIEFPIGMGRQDIVVGRPIAPEALARLNYKERKDAVIAAINALAPADEEPFPGDPEFAAAAEAWSRETGASPEHAVLFETLRRWSSPCDEVRRLVEAAAAGSFNAPRDPKGAWLAALARRLFGDRGPKVEG